MTQQDEIDLKIKNLVEHEPIRYVLKRLYFMWVIEDLKGNKVEMFWFKPHAQIKCNMYNSIYSMGYIVGVESSIKTFFQ